MTASASESRTDDAWIQLGSVYALPLTWTGLFLVLVPTLLVLGVALPVRFVVLAMAGPAIGLLWLWWQRRHIDALEARAEPRSGTVERAERATGWAFGAANEYICYPDVRVTYSVAGRQHSTSTFVAGNPVVRYTPDAVDAVLETYEPGTETTVYVDPADPTVAYLEPHPGYRWGRYYSVAHGTALALGAVALVRALVGG